MEKELITMAELAAMCGVSVRTANRWRDMGFCPAPMKLCKSVRFRRSDIALWIDGGCKDVRKCGMPSTALGHRDNGGGK